ncbi:hypothetical protein TRIATDRAFT_91339 [Trichoderma atroviride IMI 206040]|uniref:protein-tyrosine-phosphatase n=1 Tax=Hypocrea atroviridis (strain ATCC 20476 / IMI 206040) TaxID=452589 RepID=G9NMI3_HYPAI|nr:uncharacterized protein TRIATDRAFT_91339 [Trichoderma atroviride IMI 206040]EHK48113.1 hypothetical protein TRIATDRAFT_91339 [Trichoderma atroviride IMI 206040]
MAPATRHSQNLGHVVEYIPDRLYLGAYVRTPDPDTPLPGTESPRKRASRYADGAAPAPLVTNKNPPCYFTVDDTLLYNAFHHDFGPLHIGHLYRFAIKFHDILGAKENRDRPIVFYSLADPRSRANAACMLACYMVLIQNWPPHLALAPIAQIDPPLMPFRDAGYSQADYGISVQDVVYGVWKAKEEKCCDLDNFDLDQYEMYERVEHGDFNWITPNFLAFASPQHAPVAKITEGSELYPLLPRDVAAVEDHPLLPQPFKNVLSHFSERNIGLVVRLNSHLYSPSYFESMGIQHIDMIFDDGTCPPLSMVRKFIRMAHETITVKKRGVAVHCKAGLGRTGCLIGAYLIYRHGFTANEVISFMRFMRPGMVVGPQQHWLHLNQGTFREWWIEERIERKLRREFAAAAAAAAGGHQVPSTPMRATKSSRNLQATTPSNRSPSNRTPLSEVDHDRSSNVGVHEDYLPAPTPGQPRKGARDRYQHYGRSGSEEQMLAQAAEAAAAAPPPQRRSQGNPEPEEEQLHHLRMRKQRKAAQTSSRNTEKTSTSQNAGYVIDNDASFDAENIGTVKPKSAERPSSQSGTLAKVRARRQAADSPLRSKESAGVRKTSGRVGSAGAGISPAASSTARRVSGTS